MHTSVTSTNLKRLRAAQIKIAKLVVADLAYAPIFARIEHEIALIEAGEDLLTHARAIVAHQSAIA